MADATAAQKGSAPAVATEESSLLDQIVEQGRFGKETASRERGAPDNHDRSERGSSAQT